MEGPATNAYEHKTTFDLQAARRFFDLGRYSLPGAEFRHGLRSCCVDGRYSGTEAHEAPLACPGADAGNLMAAFAVIRELGLAFDPGGRETVAQAVVDVAGGPERFNFHTDGDHAAAVDAEPEAIVGRGCGHLRLAAENPEGYGLTSQDMSEIFRKLAALRSHGARETVLKGPHAEGAVMIVSAPDMGLLHQAGGMQAFVYQKALHQECLRALARRMAELPSFQAAGIYSERTSTALMQASDRQTAATLKELAPGKPVYELTGRFGESVVVQRS